VRYGDRGPIVRELLCWVEEYPIQWRKPGFDLAELAKLRWTEGYSTETLMARYGKTEVAIRNYYRRARKSGFGFSGINGSERKAILKSIQGRTPELFLRNKGA